MIIDFHTHVYPDKMAARTIELLTLSTNAVTPYSDGTIRGLLSSMEKAGIDRSVILPVATRKGQFDTINRFATEINRTYPQLTSFGGIHPQDDDPEEKLLRLKEGGFKGIKIHPDYAGTFIDDEGYRKILLTCARLGLTVVTHAGVDPAFPEVHCSPETARKVLDETMAAAGTTEPFLVFAHLGGMMMHEEVKKHLVGANCYLDISCSFSTLSQFCETGDEEVTAVIKAHGADKILFATDSPWNDQKAYAEHFCALPGLSDREKDLILHENAERLLS